MPTLLIVDVLATFTGLAQKPGIVVTSPTPVSQGWVGHLITCRTAGVLAANTTVTGVTASVPPNITVNPQSLLTGVSAVFDIH